MKSITVIAIALCAAFLALRVLTRKPHVLTSATRAARTAAEPQAGALPAGAQPTDVQQASAQPGAGAMAVIGGWRGGFKCMVTDTDPLCHNGEATLSFARVEGDPSGGRLHAVVVVNGNNEPPNGVDFTYDDAPPNDALPLWQGDYETPQGRVRWMLRLAAGRVLSGYLVRLPELHVNRTVQLTRSDVK